ncbi:MAG: chemotaxis protein CheW [Calditerrivibrio sp.]|nr:chemotaxis protein CheW [Calditerrivibrio sp.]MCA1933601.1 chemotaxis protein CheW [Calditerrivibrio sp.]MCA1981228.1 chemotaxis protein CheW [Calditerrivibrio sp.]
MGVQQYVSFNMDSEKYAVDIMFIEEIIRLVEITQVPRAPEFVEGIINIRGKVIPVVDMKKKLGLGSISPDINTRIIITNIKGKKVGFLVDSVNEVLRVDDSVIDDAPAVTMNLDSSYIKGVAKTDKGLFIVLDISKVFSSGEENQLYGF